MTNIESLRLITEAVETAGADIAPSYTEYVQLAFAIATVFSPPVPDIRQISA